MSDPKSKMRIRTGKERSGWELGGRTESSVKNCLLEWVRAKFRKDECENLSSMV